MSANQVFPKLDTVSDCFSALVQAKARLVEGAALQNNEMLDRWHSIKRELEERILDLQMDELFNPKDN